MRCVGGYVLSLLLLLIPAQPVAGDAQRPPSDGASPNAPSRTDAAIPAEQVRLPIEMPEKFLGGTPLDYWGCCLEEQQFGPRDPVYAPEGTAIVSRGKAVSGSSEAVSGSLAQLLDGDKSYHEASLVTLPPGLQWVQVDLGEPFEIYYILLWHFHRGMRIYFDVVVRIADAPAVETGFTTLFNNDYDDSAGLGAGENLEYIEDEKGRLIDAKGLVARYLRFYANGNTSNDANHYVEIEVWGRRPESVPNDKEDEAGDVELAIEVPEKFFGGVPL